MAQSKQVSTNSPKREVKFLDEISVQVSASTVSSDPNSLKSVPSLFHTASVQETVTTISDIEAAGKLQFKYALLMDTEVEMLSNLKLLSLMDDWFGTRYRLGGSGKDGIDCSALMQVFFSSLYGISLPRTSREQFAFSSKISATELKEGDLIFFNTSGGVSHVGMYLQNNKFVHAGSGGVTISDLYEDYWVKRFIGVGRVDEAALQAASSTVIKP